MALRIRDPAVAALAERLREVTGARTKTEAVRRALQHELERVTTRPGFSARNAAVLAMADALGPTVRKVESKDVCADLW